MPLGYTASMKEIFESFESTNLHPLASKSKESKGRRFPEQESENRTCFQRDRDRIIHSKAFRRLKHKTQVFVASESDHVRSRLTHSIEVAQISRHLARLLQCNEDLSEAIALAHDLGHTPFGHAGEDILNELMQGKGGFEHNLQSLRIVDHLEQKYPQFPGLNLSFEVRSGLAKHRTPWDHPEATNQPLSLEAQIANLSDEIAYNNHDLDDGLSSGILIESELSDAVPLWSEAKTVIKSQYTNLKDKQLFHLINSYLISSQVNDVVKTSKEAIATYFQEPQTLEGDFTLIRFSQEMAEKSKLLRHYLYDAFYTHHDVYRQTKKGQGIIKSLFDAFVGDPQLLPFTYRFEASEKTPVFQTQALPHDFDVTASIETKYEWGVERKIADYIAGMTDNYAQQQYHSLFS